MIHTTSISRPRWRQALASVTGAAALLAAAAGLATGNAAASPDHGAHASGAGHTSPPNDYPVPGVDYSTPPTGLQPPPISISGTSPGLAPGSIFVAPKITGTGVTGAQGPEIVDNQGRPIWFQPVDAPFTATDFRVQQYQGQPVLTYAVGQSTGGPGHAEGEDVILNQHYQQIATVSAGNGLKADQHEFALTPQGTALITIYHQVPYDLSSVGGPANGSVLDGIVQEVDVATGKVLFQWNSLDHVPLSASYQPVPTDPNTPYDYFHINGVSLDSDGNLLISARHTWTVYKVDHETGAIVWRLGGKQSDLKLGPGAQFAWQHNAQPEAGQPNTIRIFDNESNGASVQPQSRVIDVHVDPQAKTATLVDQVVHPNGGISAASQGNAQRLPDGHLFVGWGATGRFSEFDSGGNLLLDGSVPSGYDTYRAYRSPWVGTPDTAPTAVASRVDADNVDVEAIWNGATQVDRWVVLAGKNPHGLKQVGSAGWNGLDTTIDAHTGQPYVQVVALNDSGRVIGRSQAVQVSS